MLVDKGVYLILAGESFWAMSLWVFSIVDTASVGKLALVVDTLASAIEESTGATLRC